jgi:5'-methylthioadenosine phosphorylase
MDDNIRIGIIGGSGLYKLENLFDIRAISLDTPFGPPSDAYVTGTLAGVPVAFLPRHGTGHRLMPTEINSRANIFGFKQLGVTHVVSVTAVGSLRDDIRPLDIIVPDQFYDRTKNRKSTFFGNGLTAHIAFADPVCPDLTALIHEAADAVDIATHKGGTLVCIEGPAFSTRAESNLYRQWGMDIIGMTSLTEAKLAREAEICYAALALVTDYDCWREAETDVTVATVVENLDRNISNAKQIIQAVIPKIPKARSCMCSSALEQAIMTTAEIIPHETRKTLGVLVDKYLP